LELGHGDAIKSAVRSGLGVAFMARCSVDAELSSATLSEIRLSDTRLTCAIKLASRTDHRWTPVQRRFVRAVRAVSASLLAQPQPA
jgi:DNA-binding transcriptional LysR family regulator